MEEFELDRAKGKNNIAENLTALWHELQRTNKVLETDLRRKDFYKHRLLFISYKFVKGLFFRTKTYMMCVNVFFYITWNKIAYGSDKRQRFSP